MPHREGHSPLGLPVPSVFEPFSETVHQAPKYICFCRNFKLPEVGLQLRTGDTTESQPLSERGRSLPPNRGGMGGASECIP